MLVKDDAKERRKRLGQFFTGIPLAGLLAELAQADKATTIIDPMGGSGDMLVAAHLAGATSARCAVIELDPTAVALIRERPELIDVEVLNRSAFDPKCYETLGWSWDLVITNPPYVRYQKSASVELAGVSVPSSAEVQRGLIATIEQNPELSAAARSLLMGSCDYSGLSDLAVPSWILAASLVRPGGRLALVVPDTWLSRQYTSPVVHILRTLFDLEMVVEDENASWFPDAQVRTTLVIARRVDECKDPLAHQRITIPAAAASEESLVGSAFLEDSLPNRRFAEWVRSDETAVLSNRGGIQVRSSDGSDLIARAAASMRAVVVGGSIQPQPAEQVRAALTAPVPCQLLSDLQWSVGQGLRTGANDFFYLCAKDDGTVRSAITGERVLHIDQQFLLEAVRRQSDLRAGTALRSASAATEWRTLVIGDYALRADAKASQYGLIEGDLEHLIRAAATTHHRHHDGPTIPELSAVVVNERKANASSGQSARAWYHLPPLAQRHLPDIFVPRVNAANPIFYMNTTPRKVIDANFSTLWRQDGDGPTTEAMIAFLSSTWTAACLEASATAMGGGALKVEAVHLRHLPVPRFSAAGWRSLNTQGRNLASKGYSGKVQNSIDKIVESEIGVAGASIRLRNLADELLAKRNSEWRAVS